MVESTKSSKLKSKVLLTGVVGLIVGSFLGVGSVKVFEKDGDSSRLVMKHVGQGVADSDELLPKNYKNPEVISNIEKSISVGDSEKEVVNEFKGKTFTLSKTKKADGTQTYVWNEKVKDGRTGVVDTSFVDVKNGKVESKMFVSDDYNFFLKTVSDHKGIPEVDSVENRPNTHVEVKQWRVGSDTHYLRYEKRKGENKGVIVYNQYPTRGE